MYLWRSSSAQSSSTWADLFEKLADRVGRGIRYGEPPDHWRDEALTPNTEAVGRSSTPEREAKRRELLNDLYIASYRLREATIRVAHSLSALIDGYERHASTIPPNELAEMYADIVEGFIDMRSSIDELGPLPGIS